MSAIPSPIPTRDRNVYMVGAGLSTVFGLPNTAWLLEGLVDFSKTDEGAWLADANLESRLAETYEYFYPDASFPGFKPDAVDYFSTLRTYNEVGPGLPGALHGTRELERTLKFGLVHLMTHDSAKIDWRLLEANEYLTEMVRPGNIIITSNWDTLIERFAARNMVPLRRTSRTRHFPENEVTVLKLHGSIDWCQVQSRMPGFDDSDYANLSDLENPQRLRLRDLPTDVEELIRIRAGAADSWEVVRDRTRVPWIVTMVTGKSDDLGPLLDIWRDAYRALSAADRVELVGYSMPPDDVEIRTILRAGIRRGTPPEVHVRNPSPDVHARVRRFLFREATSDFMPVAI